MSVILVKAMTSVLSRPAPTVWRSCTAGRIVEQAPVAELFRENPSHGIHSGPFSMSAARRARRLRGRALLRSGDCSATVEAHSRPAPSQPPPLPHLRSLPATEEAPPLACEGSRGHLAACRRVAASGAPHSPTNPGEGMDIDVAASIKPIPRMRSKVCQPEFSIGPVSWAGHTPPCGPRLDNVNLVLERGETLGLSRRKRLR